MYATCKYPWKPAIRTLKASVSDARYTDFGNEMDGLSSAANGFSMVISASHCGQGRSATSTPAFDWVAALRTLARSARLPTKPTTKWCPFRFSIVRCPHPIVGISSAGTVGEGGAGLGLRGSGLGFGGAGSASIRIEKPYLTRFRNVS